MSNLTQIVILLGAAVLVVPLLKRLGLASVLGFLVAGVLIGPWGLGLINAPTAILHVTEFGVVLLMFVIGLELQPSRLWVLRHSVFGMGGAQVLCCGLLLGGAAYVLGLNIGASILVGLSLSLSSTAFVLQMLAEKKQLTTRYGRKGFSVLLFQDLTVIPLLALIPLLSPLKSEVVRPPVWLSIGGLLLVLLAGLALRRVAFKRVARTRSNELFTMATLLVVTGMALLLEKIGLSMSLGAFLAGVLLADSEYRHEIKANIAPFEGVLLGLFFVAVGMSANLGLLLQDPGRIMLFAVLLMLIKGVVLYGVGRTGGLDAAASRRFALYLCQGGEFAFVLFSQAATGQLLTRETVEFLNLTVTLSMAMTPFVVLVHAHWLAPRLEARVAPEFDEMQTEYNAVMIAGFGRFGQIVGRFLKMRNIPVTVLEANIDQVNFVRRFGNKVYYGDASRLDLLRAAGIAHASIFVLAIDDVPASILTAEILRQHYPDLKIYARARNRFHYFQLKNLGVHHVIRETFPASLAMGVEVLRGLGESEEAVERSTRLFIEHDQRLLEAQQMVHQDEARLIQTVKDAMKELEDLYESDQLVSKG